LYAGGFVACGGWWVLCPSGTAHGPLVRADARPVFRPSLELLL